MKLKSLLPWLCVLGLLAGLGWMYADSQKKEAELAALPGEDDLRAEMLDRCADLFAPRSYGWE